jgi:hypothetical protein
MNVNEYLKLHHKDNTHVIPRITCADGFNLSVQASHYHYCQPRYDDCYQYFSVEIGYPSERVDEFMEFAEDPREPTDTVYGQVPVDIVDAVIAKHGGIVTAK